MNNTIEALPRPLAPLGVLKVLVVLFVVLRLWLLFSVSIFQDETYYWLWGQHLAIAYYDHPPMIAWTQALSNLMFGWSKLGIRFFVLIGLAADVGLIRLISKLVAPDWPEHFWLTALVFLATPLLVALTTLALPDHLLITLSLAAYYFFLAFLKRWPERPDWLLLFAGAAFLGIAGLAKFNAAFLGIGLALYIILTPGLRPLLKTPQLYLAALVAIAPQALILLWNVGADFASYRFIFGRRTGAMTLGVRWLAFWLATTIISVGPFLVWPMLRFGLRGVPGSGLAHLVFWPGTTLFFVLSLFTNTPLNWNIMAYLVALPFLAHHLRWRWMTWAHMAYGAVVLVALLFNFGGTPLGDVKARDDDATGWAYGWTEVAAAVSEAQTKYGADFIAASDYANASHLAFALHNPDVTSLSERVDQFDFWFDPAAHDGQDAILIEDYYEGFDFSPYFVELVPIGDVPIVVNGQEIDRHHLYLGKGFIAGSVVN